MTDTLDYTDFGVQTIPETKYPPSNLFDAKTNTCWVSKPGEEKSRSLFIRVPCIHTDTIFLNIFSGYGKSKDLFNKNSRPREIKLRFYSAFTPDGYVSESHYQCHAFPLPENQIFFLKDTFGIQCFPLIYNMNVFKEHRNKVLKNQNNELKNLIDTIMLIELNITDIWEGDKYPEDICISEVFFNNCYVSKAASKNNVKIEKVYINEAENALLIDENKDSIEIYRDNESVLQIVQLSDNKAWAILNALPNEKNGRVETSYLVLDLLQKKVINQELKSLLPEYIPEEPLFLEESNGRVYIVYETVSGNAKLELRHYFFE